MYAAELCRASDEGLIRVATPDEVAAGEAASHTGIRTGTFLVKVEDQWVRCFIAKRAVDYNNDDLFLATILQCRAEADPVALEEIHELTQDNQHREALSLLAKRTRDPDLIQRVETVLNTRHAPRLAILREVCTRLPDGYHFYSAC